MLEQSLCKSKGFTLWLWLTTVFVFVLLYSNKALSFDLGDQKAIVDASLKANSEDQDLAQSLAKQARKRVSDVGGFHNTNLGPLVKLWCEAAIIAPNSDNLAECARLRFEAVGYMSNPQPSKEAVRMQRAQESLVMIRAALEIAVGDPSVSDALRLRLKSSSECFRSFIYEKDTSESCK